MASLEDAAVHHANWRYIRSSYCILVTNISLWAPTKLAHLAEAGYLVAEWFSSHRKWQRSEDW